ncbi:hypothetical protein [Deinococcus sp. LM3]|uniref:hypothetical protein n=1 Tax=Deinococcus sp. LM3 TaxID=1938608 RepID=UPI001F0B6308|nr:hypothetical protein [Deinococcus sp. LM3]
MLLRLHLQSGGAEQGVPVGLRAVRVRVPGLQVQQGVQPLSGAAGPAPTRLQVLDDDYAARDARRLAQHGQRVRAVVQHERQQRHTELTVREREGTLEQHAGQTAAPSERTGAGVRDQPLAECARVGRHVRQRDRPALPGQQRPGVPGPGPQVQQGTGSGQVRA